MEQGIRQTIGGDVDAQRRGGGRCAAGCCPWAGTFVRAMALVALMMLAPSIAQPASAAPSFGVTTLTFPAADPDVVPAVAAAENPAQVDVSVHGSPGLTAQLSVQADGDLVSAGASTPISQIRWTGQSTGFGSGVLSWQNPQRVGQWIGKTTVTGYLSFWLANSWSYAPGSYSQNLVYTLIANRAYEGSTGQAIANQQAEA